MRLEICRLYLYLQCIGVNDGTEIEYLLYCYIYISFQKFVQYLFSTHCTVFGLYLIKSTINTIF